MKACTGSDSVEKRSSVRQLHVRLTLTSVAWLGFHGKRVYVHRVSWKARQSSVGQPSHVGYKDSSIAALWEKLRYKK